MRSIYAMFLINKDKSLKKVDKTKMINSDKKKNDSKNSLILNHLKALSSLPFFSFFVSDL